MSKKSRLILITVVAIVLVSSMVLAGCQDFKWGPVGGITTGDVYNNGARVVEQGGYLYYVNGKDDVANIKDVYTNHFGKAPVKANIMKSKINAETGNLEDTEVLVPKMYNNSNKDNGLWIQEDWIYYTSPSTQADNKGTVLVNNLEFMRTKLDGTKTQSLAIVKGDSNAYTVTANALIYVDGNKIMRIPFNNKKVKKAEVVVEDVTSTLFTAQSNVIFYTKATEDKKASNNLVYVMNGNSDPVQIVSDTTFAANKDTPVLTDQKSISLKQYDAKANVLYYSKANINGDKSTGTYGYKFGETFAEIVPANEKKYSNTDLSSFYPMGFEDGVLDVSSATIAKYSVITETESDKKGEGVVLTAAPTVLGVKKFNDKDYLLYIVGSKLMRMEYSVTDKIFVEESICDVDMQTSWFVPVVSNNFVYFIDEATGYLNRVNLLDYSIKDQVISKPLGVIVSGYEDNEKVEGGKAPKFMTEADKKAWVEAHLVKEEK